MKLSHVIFGALTAAAAITSSSNAVAIDWKSMPGAGCQAYFGTQERDINKTASGAVNTATSSRWVSCLNIRDHVRNTTGTSGEWIYVVQPATSTTTCYLRSGSNSGANVETDVNRRQGSGWIYLDTAKSSVYGTYVKYCLLPPRARISTVLLAEFPDTNTN